MRWHPKARAEYSDAFDSYEREDVRVAARLLGLVETAEDAISKAPGTFPPFLHGTQRLVLRQFPFSLIYVVQKRQPIIVALAHHRRKPGYWRRRL